MDNIISDKAFLGLAEGEPERFLNKGEALFSPGDQPTSIWLVKKGRIHLMLSCTVGVESIVSFFNPGQTFCVAAALKGQPIPCRAFAAVNSVVIPIPITKFKKNFELIPVMAREIIKDFASRYCKAHCDRSLLLGPVPQRFGHLLLRLDEQYQHDFIPFNRTELAQMINSTSETCMRFLSQWKAKGFVATGRGRVKVLTRQGLENYLFNEQDPVVAGARAQPPHRRH